MADEITWSALLSELPSLALEIAEDIAKGRVPNKTFGSRHPSAETPPLFSEATAPAAASAVSIVSTTSSRTTSAGEKITGSGSGEGGKGGFYSVDESALQSAAEKTLTTWPILQDGDGGREVRALQVC